MEELGTLTLSPTIEEESASAAVEESVPERLIDTNPNPVTINPLDSEKKPAADHNEKCCGIIGEKD